jgi:tRNA nucleotidyltransferase (CCA-adding enzyme)
MESKDIDVEVFGADYGDLNSVLEKHGRTDLVGKSFGVISLLTAKGTYFDFSLPRRDSKIMDKRSDVRGRGISSEFDPSIAPKEAAARRDFTINAMAFDPLSGEVHDYFGGVNDLKNRILRATSEAFAEDPLRVLRGMQFAARFGMEVEARTAGLAAGLKNEPLVVMRVYEEWMKLFTRGKFPGKGIQYLIDTGWIENYPELKAIVNIQQDPSGTPKAPLTCIPPSLWTPRLCLPTAMV